MGSESFFVKIVPEGVNWSRGDQGLIIDGRCLVRSDDFCGNMLESGISIRGYHRNGVVGRTFVVEDAVILELGDVNGFVQDITLIGCFSWYLESIHIMFRLYEFVNSNIVLLTIVDPLRGEIKVASEDDFRTSIRAFYDEKWLWFNEIYSGLHEKIIPFEFYLELERRSKWWYRFLTLFRWI